MNDENLDCRAHSENNYIVVSILSCGTNKLIDELQIIEVNDLDQGWLNYDNYVDTSINYHYSIILSMEQILVSPEEVKESVSIVTKEVEIEIILLKLNGIK